MKTLTLSAAAVALVLVLGINGASAQMYQPWSPLMAPAQGYHGIHTHMGTVVGHESHSMVIHGGENMPQKNGVSCGFGNRC